ncbi:nuclear transport factor 2 family protein [Sphaerisporangium corydalis]|uniref:Nuclear transport factor 2 family protein n=1 Tax=Sphaerisporangium corydalis TaxID=1441875 RepID=A0ABV9EIX3_9ACTN|nr:nuclear transport factor 2 family protein [Sphaerisporangium corydalis]
MTATPGPDDRTSLLDHDRRFFDALIAADADTLRILLSDDFLLVGVADGSIATKHDLLGAVSSGALTFPAIDSFPDEAIVRRVGDTGLVVGRTSMNFTAPDGTTFTAASRYTHVFTTTPATQGWRLTSAQGTEIKPG